MHKVFKLISRITAFIFLGMLLYVYAFLPDMVSLYFDKNATGVLRVGKELFFYSALGLFIVSTLILSYMKKSLNLIQVNSSDGTMTMSIAKKSHLQTWANSLSVVFNLFFIFTVGFVGLFHNDEHFNISYFAVIIYIGPILMVASIFYLIYILFLKH
ncbi:hypothetical protein [Reichenbachiella sp. MALMAid0571]|uniref:hypothetical protein n=1 Tax=Reichenbachiella sp. MALMAid0571 TaxID=3143939 RepID=UPI0032DF988F